MCDRILASLSIGWLGLLISDDTKGACIVFQVATFYKATKMTFSFRQSKREFCNIPLSGEGARHKAKRC